MNMTERDGYPRRIYTGKAAAAYTLYRKYGIIIMI